jgi:PmbA protein
MDHGSLAHDIILKAQRQGAGQSEVYLEHGEAFSVTVRHGVAESVKQAQFKGLGLRVLLKRKIGFSYTTDFSPGAIDALISGAIGHAALSDADDGNAFSETPIAPQDLLTNDPTLANMPIEKKIEWARNLERLTFEKDPRIRGTEGTEFADERRSVIFVNSHEVEGAYTSTWVSQSISPIAEENGKKNNGYGQTQHRFLDQLDSPDETAQRAARRAVQMLGSRKIPATRASVVLDPVVAADFLGALFSAINGDYVNRGISFLENQLEKRMASGQLTIIDDGGINGLIGSKPFDGEGIVPSKNIIVKNGILKQFVYDMKAARRAGVQSTGNAGRSYDVPVHIAPNNFFVAAGDASPETIIRETARGLYVTQGMGFSFDPATGDLSFGAEGLWISGGTLGYPVAEVIVAANMRTMLMNIESVGRDLQFRGVMSSPTLKIADVTISGK